MSDTFNNDDFDSSLLSNEELNNEVPVDETTVDDSQSDGSGDIQDTTQEQQTIPYDRFQEINERLRRSEEREQQLLALIGRPSQQPQQQQKSAGVNLDRIDDESFISGKDVKALITQLENQITSSMDMTIRSQSENTTRAMVEKQEAVFRQTTPDYDTVIRLLKPNTVAGLIQDYGHDPEMLVKMAYNTGKSLIPAKATAAQVAQQAKGPQQQPPKKPVLVNDIKGGAVKTELTEDKFDEWFNKL